MRLRSAALLLLALLLVSFLALTSLGCGGSKDTESSSSTAGGSTTIPGAGPAVTGGVSTTTTSAGTAGTTGSTSVGNVSPTTARTPVGKSGVLEIGGLVDDPVTLSVSDVEKMQVETVTVEDPSGKGEQYRGVRLSELFKSVKVRSEASRVAMTAHADGFVVELSLQDIQWSPDSLLALGEDGKFNVVIPGFDKSAWVKDVVKIEFR